MNIPKKQKRIPSWLPTTVSLLAIVAVILLIYIVVTFISDHNGSTGPDNTPPVTDTPAPTDDPMEEFYLQAMVTEDSQSTLFIKVQDYLTTTYGSDFAPSSLTVNKKRTPRDGTSLIYAKYTVGDIYRVSEFLVSDMVTEAALDSSLAPFVMKLRSSSDASVLFIQALLCNFYSYRNQGDTASLSALLTTKSEVDAAAIISRMEYIDSLSLSSLSINPISSDSVDYVVLCSEEYRLLGIETTAPGLSEILIKIDSDSYPMIFIGETDEKADEAREFLKNTSSYKSLTENIAAALKSALDSDPALKAAYENMMK